MRSRSAAVLVIALAAGAVADAAAQVPAKLTTITGDRLAVELTGLDADGLRFTRPDGSTGALPLDDLETIELEGGDRLPNTADGKVWLRSGAALRARIAGGDEGGFLLDLGLGEPQRFQIAHLRAVRFEPPGAAGDDHGFADALGTPRATDDLLFAWNRNSGLLRPISLRVLGIEGDALRVHFGGSDRTVPLDQVHGIVFGTEHGFPPPPPPAPSVTAVLTDGTRLIGRPAGLADGALQLTLSEGPRLMLPIDAVDRLDVRSSRVARLSAIPPTEVVQVPALDRVPPWLVDRAPGGQGLVLGERRFARGLCLVPMTRLTWQLEPGAFDVFEATIGIDERSTGPADAVFRVLLDGEVVLEQTGVGPAFERRLRVPLETAGTLSLEVDFGEHFDLGDHCVFADARLLRL